VIFPNWLAFSFSLKPSSKKVYFHFLMD